MPSTVWTLVRTMVKSSGVTVMVFAPDAAEALLEVKSTSPL